MGDTATHKKNGSIRLSPALLSFLGWLVVTLVLGGVGYGVLTAENKATAVAVKEIRANDKEEAAKSADMRERLVRVETRQEAQGVTLDRIDKTLQGMAGKK